MPGKKKSEVDELDTLHPIRTQMALKMKKG